MYLDEPYIRMDTCERCENKGLADNSRCGETRYYCKATKRVGSVKRGYRCKHFASRIKEDSQERSEFGFRTRSKMVSQYYTENQWGKLGYRLKPDAVGEEMHAVLYAKKTYRYYLPEEVEKIDNE